MEDIIELNVEDFNVLDDSYEIIVLPNDFISVKEALENMGYDKFSLSEVTYIPDNYITLDEEAKEKVLNLIDSLEQLDDVQNVYHNLDI